MTETVNYPLPTVHLNGTDKKTLLWGNIKIQKALGELNDALQDCIFHGRDYYVQDNDPMKDAFNDDNAFSRAMDERRKHINNIIDFAAYIEKHIEHISNQ
jgi:hypothetical protein|tara:strand:+ start:360 stop:659 length:300 start_codon:yes stop_codon:yes gene_type:complete